MDCDRMLIGWCENCNSPLIDGYCYSCEKVGRPLILDSPKFLPLFCKEQEWINSLTERKYGFAPLPESDVVFVNERQLQLRNFFVYAEGEKIANVKFSSGDWDIKIYKHEEVKATKPEKLAKANICHVERLAQLAKELIRKFGSQNKIVVSFSGGKDSIVTLDLTLKVKEAPVVFINTQLEYPETVEHTRNVAEKWNLEYHEPVPRTNFYEALDILGPPSRSYRWCCKTQKLAPLGLFLKDYGFPMRIVGMRMWEALARMHMKTLSVNTWVPHSTVLHPILQWTGLDVWAYIWLHKLPINPLYEEGLIRVGCFMCPFASQRRYEITRRLHPDLYETFFKKLKNSEIKTGRWRFRKVKKRLEIGNKIEPCSSDRIYNLRRPEMFISMLRTLNAGTLEFNPVYRLKGSGFEVTVAKNRALVRGNKNNYRVRRIIKLLEKANNCRGCGLCITACPQGNIEINDGHIWVSEDCSHCERCHGFFPSSCIFSSVKNETLCEG